MQDHTESEDYTMTVGERMQDLRKKGLFARKVGNPFEYVSSSGSEMRTERM